VPFRVFGIAARPWALPRPGVLFWDWRLVQSSWPAEVPSLWVAWSRFAVSLFLGFAVFLRRAVAGDRFGATGHTLSSSFASL
jgi:hypothetical protein